MFGMISVTTRAGRVEGKCDRAFKPVLESFIDNFEARDEVGASVCVNVGGKTVVDLWGGRTSPGGAPWTRDTISIVFSCTKGASALCAHMAADRGLLDFDAPVSRYWPEFAAAGKEAALVSMMLDHTVGLPHVRAQVKPGGFYDHEYMSALIAAEAPFWRPGTRQGYQILTSAWLVGELVRRAAGKRLGVFFRDEVANPLSIDFWIGLPPALDPRLAPMIPFPDDMAAAQSRFGRAAADPESPAHFFVSNTGGFDFNSVEARRAEIGSATGVSNARGLAELYTPLANGGVHRGKRIVSREAIARMAACSAATHDDATLAVPTRFSLGFMKAMDNRRLDNAQECSFLIPEAAFGHVGAGGSVGFADPDRRLSFGYTMNRMGFGLLMNERGQSLIDAAYAALESAR